MSLKKEILTYAYSYCMPHIFDTININIKPYKDDLSDLIEEDNYLYNVIKNNVKNEDLLRRVEEAVSSEKEGNLDINSAFIGWIIGFISGVVFCEIINYLINRL